MIFDLLFLCKELKCTDVMRLKDMYLGRTDVRSLKQDVVFKDIFINMTVLSADTMTTRFNFNYLVYLLEHHVTIIIF